MWDGMDDHRRRVPPGAYLYRIKLDTDDIVDSLPPGWVPCSVESSAIGHTRLWGYAARGTSAGFAVEATLGHTRVIVVRSTRHPNASSRPPTAGYILLHRGAGRPFRPGRDGPAIAAVAFASDCLTHAAPGVSSPVGSRFFCA